MPVAGFAEEEPVELGFVDEDDDELELGFVDDEDDVVELGFVDEAVDELELPNPEGKTIPVPGVVFNTIPGLR